MEVFPTLGTIQGRLRELDMYLHDDADIATVAAMTAKAVLEGARHIGKADRGLTTEQIGQLETAIKELQRAIELNKR